MSDQEFQIRTLEVFLQYFLPEGLLDYFQPTRAEHSTYVQPQTKKQIPALHLFFDEKDNRTDETQDYTPKGFGEEVVINDFPAREKKLVLHVRRRRWITPEGKTQYLDLYAKMTADGTKFSEEFASFLKKKFGYDARNVTCPWEDISHWRRWSRKRMIL